MGQFFKETICHKRRNMTQRDFNICKEDFKIHIYRVSLISENYTFSHYTCFLE